MKFKSLFLLLAICSSLHSQEPKGILHYVFPEFQQGIVLLKNGVSYNSKLNYNIATEEMLFDDNGTSQISSTTSYSSILSGGKMYSLKLPDDYEVVPYNVYWIKRNGQLKSFSNIGQLKKIYRDKRKVVNDYLKANEVKPENVKSIEDAIIYMENN